MDQRPSLVPSDDGNNLPMTRPGYTLPQQQQTNSNLIESASRNLDYFINNGPFISFITCLILVVVTIALIALGAKNINAGDTNNGGLMIAGGVVSLLVLVGLTYAYSRKFGINDKISAFTKMLTTYQ